LEVRQREKQQHGFRCGRRPEEHFVSANLVIGKWLAVGKPAWIISLRNTWATFYQQPKNNHVAVCETIIAE